MIPLAAPQVGRPERERLLDVVEDGQLADGPEVRAFEEEFASYCGVDDGVATANGTAALHAALEALDIGMGDRVLTTGYSFVASANAVRLCGAVPVFADIDPRTFNLDPAAVEATLREHGDDIDALLVVHLYGLPAPMDRLCELADKYDLILVEDAAQAHGAEFDGQRVGSFGDAACFSFYPTKNMTTGEGGMVVTDREDVARRAAQFVNHGRTRTGEHATLGHNFRMTSLAAAIGRAQLERLEDFLGDRRANAERLSELLEDVPVTTPRVPDRARHAYNQYTVRSPDRDELLARLEKRGVDSNVYYPTPIHRQPAYDDYETTLPVAERVATEVLSLPVHPALSSEDVETVARAVGDESKQTTTSGVIQR